MIAQLVSVWQFVLTHPSVQTFEDQKASASKERTLISVIIAAVVSAILSFILTLAVSSLFRSFEGPGMYYGPSGPVAAFKALLVTLIQTLAGFYIFCYVLQYTATNFFQGRGNLDQQAYLISTYWAPISILTAVLMFVPCLGWLVVLALGIYALVLTTFAVQAGQTLAVGTAIVNWIIAAVITGIILAILGWISGGWL